MIFDFPVDNAWAKKNNELLRDSRRLQLSGFLLALIMVAAAIISYLWVPIPLASVVFGILAIVFAIIALIIPGKVGDAQQLYSSYPLVPAVIAEVNPRDVVLMALVNTNIDAAKSPRWALALRTITSIKGHERKMGTRVPAVAVSGRRTPSNHEVWEEVTPMPIAWGTPDPDILVKARKTIPTEQWDKLEKGRRRLEEVKKTKNNLLIL